MNTKKGSEVEEVEVKWQGSVESVLVSLGLATGYLRLSLGGLGGAI